MLTECGGHHWPRVDVLTGWNQPSESPDLGHTALVTSDAS